MSQHYKGTHVLSNSDQDQKWINLWITSENERDVFSMCC